MMFRFPAAVVAVPLLGSVLVSCGEQNAGFVQKDLAPVERNFRVVEASMDRFRYQARPAQPQGEASQGPKLVYDTPDGWKDLGAGAMRDVNLSFGGNGEGECYLARLQGTGGGLVANVNRWRNQMGVEPLTDDEVAALPTKTLFGQPAAYIEVDGVYTPGMGSADSHAGYRLIGLILTSDAGAVFVKMTGPKALVQANEAAFEQFTLSLDVEMP